MHNAVDTIKDEPPAQTREFYVSGISATPSTVTAEIEGLDL